MRCSMALTPPSPRTCAQYEVSDDQDSVQMLQRSTQVGEFYRMHPPPVWDKSQPLPGTYADILIYDEEADKHQHIRFITALNAACTVEDKPDQKPPEEVQAMKTALDGDGKTTLNLHNKDLLGLLLPCDPSDKELANKWHDLIKSHYQHGLEIKHKDGKPDNDRTKLLQRVYVSCTKKTLTDAVHGGVWVPFCIVIARPFIEHLMMSSIMTVSGRDTGATLFGPAGKRLRATIAFSNSLTHTHTYATTHVDPAAPTVPRVGRHADFGQHVGQDDRGVRLPFLGIIY